MKNVLTGILALALALAIGLGMLIWKYNKWKYDECRAVGHGSAYCVWERF